MIRRLRESDRASLVVLLSSAPHFNLYLLGNVDANGFEADFCEFFGDVDAQGRVRAVINRYMSGWTVFGEADADWGALGGVVDQHETVAERLQDNPGGIASFLPFLARYETASITDDELMRLSAADFQPQRAPAGFEVRKAGLDDLPQLITLFADAGDMARTAPAVERPLRDRRVWIAAKDNVPVAAALTNAETAHMGMVGGVYTLPVWRGHGLSQAVCSGLCAELMAAGKEPVLYWHNPSAGRVYHKLGFRPLGMWRSVRLARR